jgi:ACDE family multidrug resistance protein
MLERAIPEFLRHGPREPGRTPSARAFATLHALEAGVRGLLVSVFPLAMYNTFQDAGLVSRLYFAIGIVSLCGSILLPVLNRVVARRWLYSGGVLLHAMACAAGMLGGPWVLLAVTLSTLGTVAVFSNLNAYVLDYVAKSDLSRIETKRLYYSAAAWTLGPVSGVWLYKWHMVLPFALASCFALGLMVTFWWLRLGNGKVIARARGPNPNPLAYIGRFLRQPRLVAGWLFAVFRSAGWWVYIVYLPIFALENGLPEWVGGAGLSASSAALFLVPLVLRWVQKGSVRRAVRVGFAGSCCLFGLAAVLPWPPMAVAALFLASIFLILLDLAGGLPFMMAVRPAERAEMAVVYSSFRDVSAIVSPGTGALILLFGPVPAVFAAMAVGLGGMFWLAGRLHPMLGAPAHDRHSARDDRRK